ncbi:hypothetical protein D7Y04_27530 [Corallococcus sp. AB038B]|nr:hypothetical protein D7Y04_27530 [Corallococcus sp. AB038B]
MDIVLVERLLMHARATQRIPRSPDSRGGQPGSQALDAAVSALESVHAQPLRPSQGDRTSPRAFGRAPISRGDTPWAS